MFKLPKSAGTECSVFCPEPAEGISKIFGVKKVSKDKREGVDEQ